MKKFPKSLALISFVAVFAMGLTACSSDSGDDSDSDHPKSKGVNELAGKNYVFNDSEKSTSETMSFSDSIITLTSVENEELQIYGYTYIYDSDRGLLSLKPKYIQAGEKKCYSKKELKEAYSKMGDLYLLAAMMLDYLPDPFSMTVKYSYLLKPDGNVILAKYFDGSVSAGVFKYKGDSGVVVKIDADYIEFASNKSYCDDYIEIIDDIKCIKGSTTKGCEGLKNIERTHCF